METPYYRMRRLRMQPAIRDLVRETTLTPNDFILPLFVVEGIDICKPIKSMPGHSQMSIDIMVRMVSDAWQRGIKSVILFGIPGHKDAVGSDATDPDGLICRAIGAIREAVPDICITTDVCFCEYTDHGHCGPLNGETVDNDATLALLQQQVIVQAQAGAHMVAPSGMMDGMVAAIREGLDCAGFENIPIMSYAAKFASGFYGPFRDAAESAPQFGDRSSYQMDPANGREAFREAQLDVAEGADIIMVKPAMPYLDVLSRIKTELQMPTAAYQVSGEFAMIKAAAEKGWLDHDRVMMESLLSIKRAGADMILTYFALEASELLA